MNSMIKENDKIKTELASKKDELASLQSELNTQVAKLNETKASLNDEGHSQEESIKEMKNTIKYLEGLGCKDSETQTSCLNRKYSHKNNGSSGGSGGSYLPSGTTFIDQRLLEEYQVNMVGERYMESLIYMLQLIFQRL